MSTEKQSTSPNSRREWWAYLLVAAIVPLVAAVVLPSLTTPLLVGAGVLTAAAVIASFLHGTESADWMREL